MPSLHRIEGGQVVRTAVHPRRPLRLGPRGSVVDAADPAWLASLVPFSSAGRRRHALVAREGARIWLGARRVADVAEVRDRDRIFVERAEFLFSTDSHPAPVDVLPDVRCPICREPIGAHPGRRPLACPRCRAEACERCWERLPDRRCATPGCEQPASLDRPLWTPALADFLSFSQEEE